MASGRIHAEPPRDRRGGWAQKLHSLSGVVPLGAFLVLHVWITASIVSSREVYDRQIGFVHGGIVGVLEPLIILPLFFHGLYGLTRAFAPRDPDHAYDTDVLAALQRASGVVVLVFLALHLWEFRVPTWTHGLGESAYSTKLVEDLSSTRSGVPWVALGYVVGLAASVFHLVNGMTSFCTRWGYTPTVAAQHRARVFFRIGGVLLFAISAGIVVQLATGARIFPQQAPSWPPPYACGSEALPITPPPHALPAATIPRPKPASAEGGAPPLPSGGH
jgi:succinate dehydrogenase/fumarate reductase cytochrome b subunit (b558 family)